jgi:hypothetical protein
MGFDRDVIETIKTQDYFSNMTFIEYFCTKQLPHSIHISNVPAKCHALLFELVMNCVSMYTAPNFQI